MNSIFKTELQHIETFGVEHTFQYIPDQYLRIFRAGAQAVKYSRRKEILANKRKLEQHVITWNAHCCDIHEGFIPRHLEYLRHKLHEYNQGMFSDLGVRNCTQKVTIFQNMWKKRISPILRGDMRPHIHYDCSCVELSSPVFQNLQQFSHYGNLLKMGVDPELFTSHDLFGNSECGNGQINIGTFTYNEANYLCAQLKTVLTLFPCLSFATSEPGTHTDICPVFAFMVKETDSSNYEDARIECRSFDMFDSTEETAKAIILMDRLVGFAGTFPNQRKITISEHCWAWQNAVTVYEADCQEQFKTLLYLLGLKPTDYRFMSKRISSWYAD